MSMILSVCLVSNIKLNIKAEDSITFKPLYIGSNSFDNDLSTNVKITDNTKNYETAITFLVHGISSSSSAWSNDLGTKYGTSKVSDSGEFTYNPNSIIECLRRRADVDVYLIESTEDNPINDDNYVNNGFYLKRLIVDESKDEYYSSNECYVDTIIDTSKHIVVVYEASCNQVNSNIVEIAYEELEYVINKITNNVVQVNNSKVKINLIGHSRGGILNMMYATDYPYNVDGLFSIGTPYTGTSIAPLNDLLGGGFGLDGLIDSPGGSEIVNKGYVEALKTNWQNMYATYNPDINFHAIAGSTDITHLISLLKDAYNTPSFDSSMKSAILKVLTLLISFERSYVKTHNVYLYENIDNEEEKLYNSLLGLVFILITSLADTGLTNEQISAIAQLLYEIYYSTETDSLFIKTDLFVDTHSQLAKGFETDLEDNFLDIPINRYEKIFTINNCEFYDRSEDDLSIVHNNEARDLEIINYILSNITLSGTDSYINTCYLENNSLAVMWKKVDNTNMVSLNDSVSIRLYDSTNPVIIPVKGISKYFNNNYNSNAIRYVDLGNSIRYIESGAFDNHNEIISFTVNSSNSYFSTDSNNNLYDYDKTILIKGCNAAGFTSIVLPVSTRIINSSAFKDNKALTSVDLNNVRIVYEKAFYNSTSLSSISGDNLVLADDLCFYNTNWFNNINTTLKLGKVLIKYFGADEKLIIDDCTCIYSHAIYNNTTLKEIVCGAELTYIDTCAFVNNTNLENIYLFSPSINVGKAYSIVTDSENNNTIKCHYVANEKSGFTDYGTLRNCCTMIYMDEFTVDCTTTSSLHHFSLPASGYELIRFNIDCPKTYTFMASSTSTLAIELYDYKMNLVHNTNILSTNGLTTTLKEYISKGIYYLKVYYIDLEAIGDITISYQATWPVSYNSISLGTNNILSHLHENKDGDFVNHLRLPRVGREGFYKFTISGLNIDGSNVICTEGAIVIYDENGRELPMALYSMINTNSLAINKNGINEMIVFLPSYIYNYYVKIKMPTNQYQSLKLNISKITESTIDLFDVSEEGDSVVMNLNGFSTGDNLKKIVLKQAGLFELTNQGFTSGQFVILEEKMVLDDEIIFGDILIYDIATLENNTFTLVEGTYYIGYINANLYANLTFALTRKVSNYGSSYLEADPANVNTYGSEVTLNNGELYSNEITQGFTRIIYLANGESRLNYHWYSSNEKVARITSFGTVIGLCVDIDTPVKIMAVNIDDPSKVYTKEFVIKKDIKTFTSNPIERYDTIIIDRMLNEDYQIDLSTLNVPVNWLQYYTWSSSSQYLSVDQLGRLYLDNRATSDTYIITGTYKLNPRVKVYIKVIVK